MLDTIIRTIRGAVRSPTRTLIVVLVLAVGLSFALTSVALALAAEDELDKIRRTTGVEASLTINPEQFQAAIGAALAEACGDPSQVDRDKIDSQIEDLTEEHRNAIEALPYVRNAAGTSGQPVNYSLPGQEQDEEGTDPGANDPAPAPGARTSLSPGPPGGDPHRHRRLRIPYGLCLRRHETARRGSALRCRRRGVQRCRD